MSVSSTPPLSRAVHQLKREADVCWWPLVFVRVPKTLDECENPRCEKRVVVKQAHLLNGEIVVVRMCPDCANQVARATGLPAPCPAPLLVSSAP